eukprot:s330_g11.t1
MWSGSGTAAPHYLGPSFAKIWMDPSKANGQRIYEHFLMLHKQCSMTLMKNHSSLSAVAMEGGSADFFTETLRFPLPSRGCPRIGTPNPAVFPRECRVFQAFPRWTSPAFTANNRTTLGCPGQFSPGRKTAGPTRGSTGKEAKKVTLDMQVS